MAINGCTVKAVRPRAVRVSASHRIGTATGDLLHCGMSGANEFAPLHSIRNPQSEIRDSAYGPFPAGKHPLFSNRLNRSGEPNFSPLLISHKVLRGPSTPYHRAARHHHWNLLLQPRIVAIQGSGSNGPWIALY